MPPATRGGQLRNVSPRVSHNRSHSGWESGGNGSNPKFRNTSPGVHGGGSGRAVTATGLFVCSLVTLVVLLFHVSRPTQPRQPAPGGKHDDKSQKDNVAQNPNTPPPSGETHPLVLPELQEFRNTTAVCDVLYPSALTFTTVGERCMFPFKHHGEWIPDCRYGYCATRVNPLGAARALGNCTQQNPVSSDYDCVAVEKARKCEKNNNVTIPDATCSTVIENGICVCGGKLGTTRHPVKCKKTSCHSVCRNVFEDVMSTSHSFSRSKNPAASTDFIAVLAEKARKHEPKKNTLGVWSDFVEDLPTPDKLPKWCGKGIAIMAGGVSTLPQALATVAFLRGYLDSPIPVEIWQSSEEKTTYSESMKAALYQLGVMVRTLPPEAKSPTLSDMFSLKPAVVLASSFDEVLFLDADSLPLVDPLEIFQIRDPQESAVFWPDLWTLLWDAKIWEAIGGWPFGDARHAPSQESGLMVVCKSCGGWKPLALAFYFNYHNNVYYNAMYFGHYLEKSCRSNKCTRGHSVPGIGDKDTFQIAWIALKAKYTMMPPAALGGTMLPAKELVCGTSFLHFNKNNRMIALHHNSNKWWWKDFSSGRWTQNKNGLLLTHYSAYSSPTLAWRADGVNQWRSVTYSTRVDAGRQQPPQGARWCIIYKGSLNQGKIDTEMGFPVEQTLMRFYSNMYVSPWLVEWVLEHTEETPIFKCVTKSGWVTAKDAEVMEDDTLRNMVITKMHEKGKGSIPKLQAYGDKQLYQMCLKEAENNGETKEKTTEEKHEEEKETVIKEEIGKHEKESEEKHIEENTDLPKEVDHDKIEKLDMEKHDADKDLPSEEKK